MRDEPLGTAHLSHQSERSRRDERCAAPGGSSLEYTTNIAKQAEQVMLAQKEIVAVFTNPPHAAPSGKV